MITITVEDMEIYDNATEQFDTIRGGSFKFEHSLIAIQNGNLFGRFRSSQPNLRPNSCLATSSVCASMAH